MKIWRDMPVRFGLFVMTLVWTFAMLPASLTAAPYAAYVIDARTGRVLHAKNENARLHPASLTKMMTLYLAFQAIESGQISLDTKVTISKNAAAEPPSKLGLRAGQRISMRYLIRAAAVKSANDAATAIGEALAGSEAAFARRMTRTARALGMSRTTFKNAHGLTANGHMSTAHDMTILGRHILYDFPQYYHLFSREKINAGVREVANTNRRFLSSYKGADGIKTGYTRAAGSNLVASAQRGKKRIIATVFGAKSSAARAAKVSELMDLGFSRAPKRAFTRKTRIPNIRAEKTPRATTKTTRVSASLSSSLRPRARPNSAIAFLDVKKIQKARPNVLSADINSALAEAQAEIVSLKMEKPVVQEAVANAADIPEIKDIRYVSAQSVRPVPRPESLSQTRAMPIAPQVATRSTTPEGRNWGVNVGRFDTRYKAERVLVKTALAEMTTLDGTLRKVVRSNRGFEANFIGMDRKTADLACRRLKARNVNCNMIGP